MLEWVGNYVDLDYMLWVRTKKQFTNTVLHIQLSQKCSVKSILLPTQVKWLLSPIILTFVILPMILLTLIYVSSLSLYIYQAHRKRLIR